LQAAKPGAETRERPPARSRTRSASTPTSPGPAPYSLTCAAPPAACARKCARPASPHGPPVWVRHIRRTQQRVRRASV